MLLLDARDLLKVVPELEKRVLERTLQALANLGDGPLHTSRFVARMRPHELGDLYVVFHQLALPEEVQEYDGPADRESLLHVPRHVTH